MKNNVIQLIQSPYTNLMDEFNEICTKYDRQYFMYNNSLRLIGDGKIYSKFSMFSHNNQLTCFASPSILTIDDRFIQRWIDDDKADLIEDLINNIKYNRVEVKIEVKNIE